MPGENFKNIVKEATETEPLNKFGLKFIGIGADSMVFETPGSERKVMKVNIGDVMSCVFNLLNGKSNDQQLDNRKQSINERKIIEDHIAEVFGEEHLLKSGHFRIKVPVTKKIMEQVLADNNNIDENLMTAINQLDQDSVLMVETIAETQVKAPEPPSLAARRSSRSACLNSSKSASLILSAIARASSAKGLRITNPLTKSERDWA